MSVLDHLNPGQINTELIQKLSMNNIVFVV